MRRHPVNNRHPKSPGDNSRKTSPDWNCLFFSFLSDGTVMCCDTDLCNGEAVDPDQCEAVCPDPAECTASRPYCGLILVPLTLMLCYLQLVWCFPSLLVRWHLVVNIFSSKTWQTFEEKLWITVSGTVCQSRGNCHQLQMVKYLFCGWGNFFQAANLTWSDQLFSWYQSTQQRKRKTSGTSTETSGNGTLLFSAKLTLSCTPQIPVCPNRFWSMGGTRNSERTIKEGTRNHTKMWMPSRLIPQIKSAGYCMILSEMFVVAESENDSLHQHL